MTTINELYREFAQVRVETGLGHYQTLIGMSATGRQADLEHAFLVTLQAYRAGDITTERQAGETFWYAVRDKQDRAQWVIAWWNYDRAIDRTGAALAALRDRVGSITDLPEEETPVVSSGYANRSMPETVGRGDRYVALPDGSVGLVPRWTIDNHRVGDPTYRVWRSDRSSDTSMVEGADFYWLHRGDPITASGQETIYIGPGANEFNVQTEIGACRSNEIRQTLWETHSPAEAGTPATIAETVTVEGVEYVRKDMIDKDMTTLKTIMHAEADRRRWCGEYDDIAARTDAEMTYLKLGLRRPAWTVSFDQTITVRRTMTLPAGEYSDEARVREYAQSVGMSYYLRSNNVSGRYGSEEVTIVAPQREVDNIVVTPQQ